MTASISCEPFEKLIVSLRDDGLLKESDQLHDLIQHVAWTTGSELIGELGLAIRKMKQDHPAGLSGDSRKHIRECMKTVRRVWPDFPE